MTRDKLILRLTNAYKRSQNPSRNTYEYNLQVYIQEIETKSDKELAKRLKTISAWYKAERNYKIRK